MLPACLFTFKQKKSGYALRKEKHSFNKGWNQEHGRFKQIVFFLLSFGVGSLFISDVGQPAASAEADCLGLSFLKPPETV